jgi:cytochrome c biogenesis protein CcdA
MLDMFSINGINFIDTSKLKFSGFTGSFFMGLVFALAFCPISAALYFGTVIPLSINNSSPFIIPFLYGLGTAIPIIIIAILIEFGFKKISLITKFIGRFEKKLNNLTAYVFIISGIYLALKYIFEII